MGIECRPHCKVNLILNILGRRTDGYHELETLLLPVALHDHLEIERGGAGIDLHCNVAALPTDGSNLVHRAAARFLGAAKIQDGLRIRLQKVLPMEAGLGGGSGNAAATLRALNQLYGHPLEPRQLHEIATTLGSDVPFFLQDQPALATGRGEILRPLQSLRALQGRWILIAHPGFGVPTPWAYKQLTGFPQALNGTPGRAARMAEALQAGDLNAALPDFYNAFESPVLTKYPLLFMIQEFFRDQHALATLLCGSGSAMFALVQDESAAQTLRDQLRHQFGEGCWTGVAPL